MDLEIHEIYNSFVFPDMWECRNKEGFLIGCGASKEEAVADVKTYSDDYNSSTNMRNANFL